eukprot:1138818-Pelagomonas_calceolata.AAC.9
MQGGCLLWYARRCTLLGKSKKTWEHYRSNAGGLVKDTGLYLASYKSPKCSPWERERKRSPIATTPSQERGGRGMGRGRAGVSEPMEVSQDTAEFKDEEIEDGKRLQASAFMHAKTRKFVIF